MTADDVKKRIEEDRKKLEQQNEQRAKAAEERARSRGRPTPTQMENDLAALGHHPELEPDGSPPDPYSAAAKKDVQAGSAGSSYQTRQVSAASESQRASASAAKEK
jgi:hypothetical protein